MALVACRECGKKISTEAKSCIGCGAPNPTSKTKKISKDTYSFTLIEKVKYFLNGQYSLAHSFWFVGVLMQMVVATPFLYFFITGVDDVSDFTAFILVAYAIFLYAFNIGVIIGSGVAQDFILKKTNRHFGVM